VFKWGLKQSLCLCVFVCDEGFRTYRPGEFTARIGSGEWSICCMISGNPPDVDEIFALLGYFAAYSDNSLPTFRPNTCRQLQQGAHKPRATQFCTMAPNISGSSVMEPVLCHPSGDWNFLKRLPNIWKVRDPWVTAYLKAFFKDYGATRWRS
jgi:hypothetical protein